MPGKKKTTEVNEEIVNTEEISEKKSKKTDSEKKSALEKIKAKVKALEGKFEEEKTVDIKGEVKGDKEEKKDTLVPIEDYLKSSIHLGTKVITPHMRKYVYRRRADGLAVFNTALQDDLIKDFAGALAEFSPEDIVVVCKREAGWHAVNKFAETFGIKVFTKKYPAGTLTNPQLQNFFERELMLICDPWLDKNALEDAGKIKMKVYSICDTNNYTFGVDKILPGNNKSAKSLGMIFFLLAKIYAEKRGIDVEIPTIQEFVEGWDDITEPANVKE